MKKFLLLIAVAVVASAAIAGVDYTQKQERSNKEVPQMLISNDVEATEWAEASEDFSVARPLGPKALPETGQPFYFRPYGTFYAGYNTLSGSAFWKPYLFVPAYRTSTYRGREEGDWLYQVYNSTTKAREWVAAEGKDLPVYYKTVYDSVPKQMLNGSEYFLWGWLSDKATKGHCVLYPRYDIQEMESMQHFYASPKYFSARQRDDATKTGIVNLTGARYDTTKIDKAYHFGRNWSGWNACAIYCEKPENPYVLRGAAIRYVDLKTAHHTDDVELTMRVYKVTAHEADTLGLGELLATAKSIISGSDTLDTNGEVYFQFVDYDEEFDITFDLELEVDDEIAVVLSGYENDNILKMGLPIARDMWDEGIGEIGYNIHLDEDGNLARAIGLTRFFSSAQYKGYSAPAIFLDVVYPFIINNYTNDKSVRKYDAEGTLIYDGTETLYYGSNFSAYTTKSSEDWEITLADGSDVPDWLTLTPEDEIEDNAFTGEVNVGIEVEPLPEGLAGRKAVVRFKIPGHYHDLTIIQGEEPVDVVPGDVNGDGVCNASDVTALYNYILNNDDSAIVNGDQNNDDVINTGDVTTVYNIILGD